MGCLVSVGVFRGYGEGVDGKKQDSTQAGSNQVY